jgi:hypothetical protein
MSLRHTFQNERGRSFYTDMSAAVSPSRRYCYNVHERVRKAHFGAVDDTIPYSLHQGKNVMVFWV